MVGRSFKEFQTYTHIRIADAENSQALNMQGNSLCVSDISAVLTIPRCLCFKDSNLSVCKACHCVDQL